MTPLTFQTVRVAVDENGGGLLVFDEGRLAAVLVKLGAIHEARQGCWFLEAGFGPLAGPEQPVFPTVEDAQVWIEARLGAPDGLQTA